MKKLFSAVIFTTFASPAIANTVTGTVQDHYRTVIERQPYTTEVCRDVNVPNQSGPNTGGAIIGGIVGGVIGNQFGGGRGKEAATGAGALAGAIIGGNTNRNQGYHVQRQCSVETRYQEQERTVYSHSTITFYEDGRNFTLRFQKR